MSMIRRKASPPFGTTTLIAKDPRDDVLNLRLYLHLGERHLQAAHDRDRENHPEDGAAAAEDRDTTEQDNGDHIELKSDAG